MKITKLSHAYKFPEFRPLAYIKEVPGEAGAVIVPLKRTYQKKDRNAQIVAPVKPVGTTINPNWLEISPADNCEYISNLRYGAYNVGSATW